MKALQHSESHEYGILSEALLLVLAALLLFNPLRILYVIESITQPAYMRMENHGEAVFIMAFTIAFLVYSFVVPVYFFLHKKAAPVMIIILFLINIAFVAMSGLTTEWLPSTIQHTTNVLRTGEMALSAILFLVWTLYLTSSEHIRDTFVR